MNENREAPSTPYVLRTDFQREALNTLHAIQQWLARISDQLSSLGAGEGQIGLLAPGFGADTRAMELLLAYALPSSPAYTEEITVRAAPPVLLYSNDSLGLVRLDITNDDPAQPMWVGGPGVLPTMGRVVLAQNTIPYVVMQGAEVWAVCVVATISARVSVGNNLDAAVRRYLEGA